MSDRYLSRAEVCLAVGLSRTTIWKAQKRGEFPPWEAISRGRVGVLESKVDRWLAGERSGWPIGNGGRWRGPPGSQGRRKGRTPVD